MRRAQIGRTVLSTYPPDNYRQFEVVRPYHVHITGLRLKIEGLAYQEQDQGAAVCASTALWCALQRVAYVCGHRTPTPSQITEAAGSPLPASYGLSDSQMATALADLGYTADQFFPAENRLLFRANIAACLQSQLPVILLITTEQKTGAGTKLIGHAVTVTGFRDPIHTVNVPMASNLVDPVPMNTGSLEVLYVHDDNLGCHAHYELFDVNEKDKDGFEKLQIRRGRTDKVNPDWWTPDTWTVYSALVPKADKMRLPINQLFSNLVQFRSLFCDNIFPGIDLRFSVKFAPGVGYKHQLITKGFHKKDLREFLSTIALPRFIGVISVWDKTNLLCDVLVVA